jgi:CDP-glycerol glycerophosphotransferase (TagB/SpsB family)
MIEVRKKIWLFGSHNGNSCGDNSKALFYYAAKHIGSIRSIWITKNRAVMELLREQGLEAHMFYSWNGIKYALKADNLFISHSFLDLSLFAYLQPWKVKIIQLWHGTPLKRLESHKFPIHKEVLLRIFLKYIGRDCDMLISATKLNEEIYRNKFNLEAGKIKITGQPRNDALFSGQVKSKKTTILFLPTWREYETKFSFFSDNYDTETVNRFLKENDAELVLKLHPADKKGYGFKKYSNITHLGDDVDLYEFLARTDILLTDYSSVYFDFLLLNRPIIFCPFDIDEYQLNRGFYYDYEQVTPGPKAHSWGEVLENIKEIIGGADGYAADRVRVCDLFNEFKDDKSSKRVVHELLSLK